MNRIHARIGSKTSHLSGLMKVSNWTRNSLFYNLE